MKANFERSVSMMSDAKQSSKIIAAQIIGYSDSKLILKTQQHKVIRVSYNAVIKKGQKLFQTVIHDIMAAGLWIPVNIETKEVMAYDWLDDDVYDAAF